MMADNAREDIQQEPDVTNQTKGWIEMCGVRLDNVLDRTHGNRKVIIEGIFRMPFVFMLFAWTTLGPSADSRLLEIPCLLCRYLGMLKWMAHAQTGFQTILPLYRIWCPPSDCEVSELMPKVVAFLSVLIISRTEAQRCLNCNVSVNPASVVTTRAAEGILRLTRIASL
ncbi:hypothetical protein DPMN_177427 [Dreissena polymorpha]|uniref:Uncharacterized protein n=1 Tax=Dreissena polymorpha TaxID=45954 RepID=A0A9D4IHU0_DREPO|nr:hypothetical protein DPMN_177427 [Dreissena polymorpha]